MRIAPSTANFLRSLVGAAATLAVVAGSGTSACRGRTGDSSARAAEDARAETVARAAEDARSDKDAGAAADASESAPGNDPANLEEALAHLRARRLEDAAAVIAARATQREPKMKLTGAQALLAATYLLQHIPELPRVRALHEVMPHSTVELVRAVAERGVSTEEAERIADYLLALTAHLDFANLQRFDINHSHVTGREWHEIDYSGENMTWQSQKAYWSKKGVDSFETAEDIHRYFQHAYELPHFARVYRPRNRWAGFHWP